MLSEVHSAHKGARKQQSPALTPLRMDRVDTRFQHVNAVRFNGNFKAWRNIRHWLAYKRLAMLQLH